MGKRELSAVEVQRLVKPGRHAVGPVAGLALQVQSAKRAFARSWVLRIMVGGKRVEMGLGAFPDVTLADARRRARELREQVDKGVDPISERNVARRGLAAKRDASITFKKAAEAYIGFKAAEWSNRKHALQWASTLETYAFPVMGDMLVADIDVPQVLKVLEPNWLSKTETMNRVRNRIELVLDWATARKYRPEAPNPARWRGHMDKLLARPSKVAAVVNHRALPFVEAGAFMQRLRTEYAGMSARALEFLTLTAVRSGEVRGATWAEIDLDAAVWIIGADRMKAGREHRVPLSAPALQLLRSLPVIEGADLVFPSPRSGRPLSDMALSQVVRAMGVNTVVHGLRSTFRDWCAERTNYPRDVAEMALAHTIGDKVEAAYRRGDLFEKRSRLMEEWGAYVERPEEVWTGGATVGLSGASVA